MQSKVYLTAVASSPSSDTENVVLCCEKDSL